MPDFWEIKDYVSQAVDDYTAMATDAEKSGKVTLASYYDGIMQGMKQLLDYIEYYNS